MATLSGVSLAGLNAGTYSGYVGAAFAGDSSYGGSSATANLTVASSATAVAVTALPASSIYGQSVTLSATITALAPGGGVPGGGTVTFRDNGTTLGSSSVSGGTATWITSSLGLGLQVITATYSGSSGTFLGCSSTLGPSSLITTVAGDGSIGDNGPATAAFLNSPYGTAVDAAGDIFVADTSDNCIREVLKATGQIITVAGSGAAGFSGDGGQATAAKLNSPRGLALDSSGDLYIADYSNNRIRRLNLSSGVISTAAGNGTSGFSGDAGPATAAELANPSGVAVDAAGNLYVVDSGNGRVRLVNASTGAITTLAGSAVGDGCQATNAPLNAPYDAVTDSAGNIYIADSSDNRVREVIEATGQIITIAGTGASGAGGDGGPATAALLNAPRALALDGVGDLFVADYFNNRVREINLASGTITTATGNGTAGFSGDGGQGTAAELSAPDALAVDRAGNLLISDGGNNRVRKLNLATGLISTAAGNGTAGFSGDGATATVAELSNPTGVAVDSSGDLFIADCGNYRVREVNVATGNIATVAGDGWFSSSGDGGAATAASFLVPSGVAVDAAGNLYISDAWGDCVREVNASTQIINTVAGTGWAGYSGDGGNATAAQLNSPEELSLDAAGNLLIADASNNRLRAVNLASHVIRTVAGTGATQYGGDGGPATLAVLGNPQGVAVDAAGDVYIADYGNNRVREVVAATGLINTVAGNGSAGFGSDGGLASAAMLSAPAAVVLDSAGDLFIADYGNRRVREVAAVTHTITTLAGSGTYGFSGDGKVATAANLAGPRALALDASGHLDFADTLSDRIRQINLTSGLIATVAGGFTGDGLAATAAVLTSPADMVADARGDLFIADTGDNRVREINAATGVVTTIAGTGLPGFSGDGGLAGLAMLSAPRGLAFDSSGNLYIADSGNGRIRKVNLSTDVITTVAGSATFTGSIGDGGQATAATLSYPCGVAVDSSGNLYIADTDDGRIRKVNAAGVITTVAGVGAWGYNGDGGKATSAWLNQPQDVAVDASGNLYIADTFNSRIRKVNASTGVISTLAGTGAWGFSGDGGKATAAALFFPAGVALDAAGDLFIADTDNDRVREVTAASGLITTMAGTGAASFGGDGAAASAAALNAAAGVALDNAGDLFIADTGDNRIRRISSGAAALTVVSASSVTATSFSTSYSAAYGSSLSLAATLQAGGVALSGATLIFSVSGTVLGTAVTNASGVATLAGASLGSIAPGTYANAVSAVFVGNASYQASSAQTSLTITKALLTIAVNSVGKTYGSPDPTFTATYTGLASGETGANLTGTLAVATGEPANGFAPPGTYALAPSGQSSNNYTITYVPGTLTVTPATTALALSVTPGTVTYGQALALTAAITAAAPSAAVPTGGTVTFFDGTALLGTATLSAGSAAIGGLALAAGTHAFTVRYSGDGADFGASCITVALTSTVATLAGSAVGDGGPAAAAPLNAPYAMVADAAGDLFIADSGNNRIREVLKANGQIITIAGTGTAGFSGDGGPAAAAQLSGPRALALDAAGNLYVADYSDNRVREINLASGIITTVAGTASTGYSGDGGPATAAALDGPTGVAVDGSGDLFIADYWNNRVREVNATTRFISTVAGNGTAGYTGDGGQGTAAEVNGLSYMALDSAGNLYFSQWTADVVRKVVLSSGIISTVAGDGSFGNSGDGGPATAATFEGPTGLACDAAGNLYIADNWTYRIRKVNLATGIITGFAGTGASGYGGDGAPASTAVMDAPQAVAVDAAGDLFIADTSNNRVREVNHATGLITTVAGTGTAAYGGDGAAASAAKLSSPSGVALDGFGDLFIADTGNNRIREINLATDVISTFAGTGTSGFGGDGSAATAALLAAPRGVAVDAAGDVFIADTGNNRLREVSRASGKITTVAGTGTSGFGGDGSAATAALLAGPRGVAVDSAGDVYIADYGNNRIREVNAAGTISTVAGTTTGGYSGDGQAATAARLNMPTGLAVDAAGDLFIADSSNNRVREVAAGSGLITTLAGTGTAGFSGDGGAASAAAFSAPAGLAIDAAGNLYVADTGDNRLRTLPAVGGLALTVAPAILTVTANNTSRMYGAADPAYSATVSGFANGDTLASVVTGSPAISSTDTAASPAGTYSITAGLGTLQANSNYTFAFVSGTLTVNSTIAGRNIFYANSSYNGNSDAASSADDNAIDTSKSALLPGQTATFANYVANEHGINGIMVDVTGLANPAALTAADFQFLVGNDSTPSDWTSPAVAPTVTVRVGAGTGGSDRVELIWPDDTIRNEWLQVTVLADANTGLASNDVFYFGSEPGAVMGNGYVSFDDIFAVYRTILAQLSTVTASTAADVNHDGMIDFDDIFAVYRAILANNDFTLNMITAPATPADSPAATTALVAPTASVAADATTPAAVPVVTPTTSAATDTTLPVISAVATPVSASTTAIVVPLMAAAAIPVTSETAVVQPVLAATVPAAAPMVTVPTLPSVVPAATFRPVTAIAFNPPQAVIVSVPLKPAARSATGEIHVGLAVPETAPTSAAIPVMGPPSEIPSSTASPAGTPKVPAPSVAASASRPPLPLPWVAQPVLFFDLVPARTQDWSWAELPPDNWNVEKLSDTDNSL